MVYKTEQDIERITNSHDWIKGNKELVKKFDQERKALKTAITTRSVFICAAKRVDQLVRKPFKKINKQDMVHFISKRADQKYYLKLLERCKEKQVSA